MRDRARPGDFFEPIEDDITEYWQRFADAFASPLSANSQLSNFVTNQNVTGAYAEAWVRQLCRSMIPNMKMSTGAIIRTTDVVKDTDLRAVPQIDLILWDPSELPALFEAGEFALVHTQAARGIIEIKRSIPNPADLEKQLQSQKLRLLSEYRRNTLGVVVQHSQGLFSGDVKPTWVEESDSSESARCVRLLDSSSGAPDRDGIFALIYFLSHVARKAKAVSELTNDA